MSSLRRVNKNYNNEKTAMNIIGLNKLTSRYLQEKKAKRMTHPTESEKHFRIGGYSGITLCTL